MRPAGERADVAIVGAGFGGLALASLCADAGLRVVVLERRPELAPEGVGLVVQPNGLAVLARLGVLEAAVASGERITRAEQRDPSGRVLARGDYGELDHPHPSGVVIGLGASLGSPTTASAALRFACIGGLYLGAMRRGITLRRPAFVGPRSSHEMPILRRAEKSKVPKNTCK